MTGQAFLIFYSLLASASISAVSARIAWRRRTVPGALAFTWLMAAVTLWALTSALEKLPSEVSTRILIAQIQYLGITSIGPLWLIFALEYTQQEHWLSRRAITGLWILPVITVLLAWTNPYHHLVWSNIVPSSGSPGMPMVYEHGPWFWVFTAYLYLLLFTGTMVLIWALVRFPQVYRQQAVTFLAGCAIPWIANIIYLAGLSPIPGLDLTPLGFALSGAVFAWGVFRLQMFNLVPIARDAVIESMVEGVIIRDAQGRIADINPSAKALLRLPQELNLGQSAQAIATTWPALANRHDDSSRMQAEIHLNGGDPSYIELHIAPLQDRRGRFLGDMIILRDISERKVLEKTRDDLTQTIVHDLRNPLTVISTSLEILKMPNPNNEERLSEEQNEILDIASINVQRMGDLISSILDISRLERGVMPVRHAPFALAILATNVVDMQALLAHAKNLQLESMISTDLPQALGDASLIQRVLQNLVDNAVKFTPNGGTVQIDAIYSPEEKQIVVEVNDTGPGVPPELQGRLFQKFASGTHSRSGSGLGLAFCRLAVEAHGGQIWVESKPDKGTTFAFSLPAAVFD